MSGSEVKNTNNLRSIYFEGQFHVETPCICAEPHYYNGHYHANLGIPSISCHKYLITYVIYLFLVVCRVSLLSS